MLCLILSSTFLLYHVYMLGGSCTVDVGIRQDLFDNGFYWFDKLFVDDLHFSDPNVLSSVLQFVILHMSILLFL